MSIIGFVIFGFVVGLLARALLPGTQKLGIIATALLGIGGSLLGGLIGNMFTRGHADSNTAGWIGSVIGAIVLLGIYIVVARRMHGGHSLSGPRTA